MEPEIPAAASGKRQAASPAARGRLFRMEQIFARLPVALAVLDSEARFIEANARFLTLFGRLWADLSGRRITEFWPEVREALPVVLARVRAGEVVEARKLPWNIASEQGTRRTLFWNACHVPLLRADGTFDGMLCVLEEVTEQERLHARRQALVEASLAVSRARDMEAIFGLVYDTLRETLAFDRCGLFLADRSEQDALFFQGIYGTDRSGRRHPRPRSFSVDIRRPETLLPHHGLREILQGEMDYHLVDVLDLGLPADHPMAGVGHHANVALRADGDVLGLICLDNLTSQRAISGEEIAELLPLARQAAFAIENVRRFQAERGRREHMALAAQEANHRIKNNLQALAAYAEMRAAEAGAAETTDALRNCLRQIQSISAVHELLSRSPAETGFVSARDLLRAVVGGALKLSAPGEMEVRSELDVEELALPPRAATALGLIAQELCANAVRHGLRGLGGGLVRVALKREAGQAVFSVQDSGTGFPPGFDAARVESIGIELIYILARREFDCEARFENAPEGGARITLRFAYPLPATF